MKPSSLTINGIHFEYGDNGEQRYYDCVLPNGDYVVIVQPYHRRIAPRTLWWAAHIWRGDRVCGLADSTEDYDGEFIVCDPLWNQVDPGTENPPMQLLTAIANLLTSGVDPFTIDRVRIPADEFYAQVPPEKEVQP
jgi:hypothetical protein